MGWLLQRKLTQNSKRLRSLREELAQLDEQAEIFASDADDQELRAMVSETPGASHEATDARKHANAIAKHRQRVHDRIRELETQQDELLDRLGA